MIYILFIGAAVAGAACGYLRGKHLKNRAAVLAENPHVPSDNNSINQARNISSAIKERAEILGNSDLSHTFKGDKNYIFYAFDKFIDDGNKHTRAFLKGECVKLIRFIRTCHSYGIGIYLYQIGYRLEDKASKKIIYTQPEAGLYKKN